MSLPLKEHVAGEVRAGLARKRMTQTQLASALRISPATLTRRLSGDIPFDIEEIEAIARILDVPLASLMTVPAA